MKPYKVTLFGVVPCRAEVDIEATDEEDARNRVEAKMQAGESIKVKIQGQPMWVGDSTVEAARIVKPTPGPIILPGS